MYVCKKFFLTSNITVLFSANFIVVTKIRNATVYKTGLRMRALDDIVFAFLGKLSFALDVCFLRRALRAWKSTVLLHSQFTMFECARSLVERSDLVSVTWEFSECGFIGYRTQCRLSIAVPSRYSPWFSHPLLLRGVV